MNIYSLLRELSGPRPLCRVRNTAKLGCWHPPTTYSHIPGVRDSHSLSSFLSSHHCNYSPFSHAHCIVPVLGIDTFRLFAISTSSYGLATPSTDRAILTFTPMQTAIPRELASVVRISRLVGRRLMVGVGQLLVTGE